MENVNKQLLERWAAFGKAMQKAGSELPRHLIAETEQIIAASEQAQQAVPVARDVLMQVAETVRDECASAWCDRANKEFEVDITSIVERYATTASQARAIINEQAEKLAKCIHQWDIVGQSIATGKPIVAHGDLHDLLRELASYAPSGICAPTALQGFAIRASNLLTAQPPAVAVPDGLLTADDMEAMQRFAECCEDFESGGHDVPKAAMKRLELAGAVRSCGFGRHETTLFGDAMLAAAQKGGA